MQVRQFYQKFSDADCLISLRNEVMQEACFRCGKYGYIKSHGFLYNYNSLTANDETPIRGLRFFVPTAILTMGVAGPFQSWTSR